MKEDRCGARLSGSLQSPDVAAKQGPSQDVTNASGSTSRESVVVRKEDAEDDIAAFMAERENVSVHTAL